MAASHDAPPPPDRFGAFLALGDAPATPAGPLAGLRIAVKDNIAVAGMPFTAGQPLFADRVAANDAEVVRRLRAAGARILGVTRTDSGGFGVTPTRARLPTEGVWPLSPSLDHVGIIAREPGLAARALAAMLDAGDEAGRALARTPRIGVERAADPSWDASVTAGFAATLETLRRNGFALVPIAGFARERALAAHRDIVLREARDVYAGLSDDELRRLAPLAQRALLAAKDISPAALATARRVAGEITAAVDAAFATADVILSPTLCCGVPAQSARRVAIGAHEVNVVHAMIGETALYNLSGHPAVALPANAPRDGVGFSIQLAAPAGSDLALIEAAAAIAAALRVACSTGDT
ncbi:MAG: hypothetical protein HY056_01045 [Proteobacteria bacterium]|nr:hypothetical protein [Pseudomonadota bacterium]